MSKLQETVDRFISDTNTAHEIVHGGVDTVVPTDGGPVDSFAKMVRDTSREAYSDIIESADGILAQTETVRDEAKEYRDEAAQIALGDVRSTLEQIPSENLFYPTAELARPEASDHLGFKAPADQATPRFLAERMLESVSALDFALAWDVGFEVAVNRAIDYVYSRNNGLGGVVRIPNLGTVYGVNGPILMRAGVELRGLDHPTIRLNDGVGTNIISQVGFASLRAAAVGGGIDRWSVRGLILDGNRDGNPAAASGDEGNGLALYGWNFLIDDLRVRNTRRSGVITLYDRVSGSGLTDAWNGHLHKLYVSMVGEHGWLNSVSDLHCDDVNVQQASMNANDTFDGIWTTRGIRLTNINVWTSHPTNWPRYALNMDGSGGTTVFGAHLESAVINLHIAGMHNFFFGYLYNGRGRRNLLLNGNYNTVDASISRGFWDGDIGIQLGIVGSQAAYNNIKLRCAGLNGGCVEYVNSAFNDVNVRTFQQSSTLVLGVPTESDSLELTGTAASIPVQIIKKFNVFASIVASGTSQASATPLTRASSNVTGADGINGVLLPAAWGGREMFISNRSSGPLNVYPATGEAFVGMNLNSPFILAANSAAILRSPRGGLWNSV